MLSVWRLFLVYVILNDVSRVHSKEFNLQAVWVVDPTAAGSDEAVDEMKDDILAIMRWLKAQHPNTEFGIAQHTHNEEPCFSQVLALTPKLAEFEKSVEALAMSNIRTHSSIPFPAIYMCWRDDGMGWNRKFVVEPKKVFIYTTALPLNDDSGSYKATSCGKTYNQDRRPIYALDRHATVVIGIVPQENKWQWQEEFRNLALPHEVMWKGDDESTAAFSDRVVYQIYQILTLPAPTEPPPEKDTLCPVDGYFHWWMLNPFQYIRCAFREMM